MERHHRVLATCFGAISALGPLALDMYLSAMPTMAAEFGAAEGRIEQSVMVFFLGFCLGQLVFGPLSDRTGRKPVVLIGLTLYLVASVGAASAGTLDQFIAWRALQGIGGSVGMVIAMASIRDLFTGAMAAKLLSMVVMVLGLAPVVAPILGSAILAVAPWQAIFALQAVIAALVLLVVWRAMPETRSPEARQASRPSRAFGTYIRLLFDRSFIPYAGTMALSQGGFFAYISVISVVLISVFGVSTFWFSIIFAGNALGLAVTSQVAGRLVARVGAMRLARMACLFRGGVAVVMIALVVTGGLTLPWFVGLCFLLVASLGCVMPCCSVLALERQGQNAGVASALMGALGFGCGAVVSGLVAALSDGTAAPIAILLSASALLALAVSVFGFSSEMETAVAAE
ncbi:multidrug effflux MFS transporter [Pseudooceanicola sp. LIPI14-2-Ac024]|uniref:multidrug effflux MFS transporter n=1 Tax=Pseudooceanicola sp. LIPI14-2-Ac024 TaxID=3344875 RepID=UPI0035CEFF3F